MPYYEKMKDSVKEKIHDLLEEKFTDYKYIEIQNTRHYPISFEKTMEILN